MNTRRKVSVFQIKTKSDAVNFINSRTGSDQTKKTYISNLEKLCRHFETDNVSEMLKDPELFMEKVKTMTYERDDTQLMAEESFKSYFTMIRTITKDGNVSGLTKAKIEKYNELMTTTSNKTKTERKKREAKGATLAKNPDLKWTDIITLRDTYIKKRNKTFRNLRPLLLVSFNTFLKPRRLDLRFVQYLNKEPKGAEKNNYESCLVISNNKAVLTIGKYKTRYKLGEEQMKPFVKTLPKELAVLTRAYIDKAGLKPGEYLFHGLHDKTTPQGDSTFSKYITTCSKAVLGKEYPLGCNEYRHLYISFVADHYRDYDTHQLEQICEEMGDMSLMTNLNYAISKRKEGETISEIEDRHQKEAEAEKDEQEGSVAGASAGEGSESDDETPQAEPPSVTPVTSTASNKETVDDIPQILDSMYNSVRPHLIALFTVLASKH